MTMTYRLSNISHVVDIATTLKDSWFRGHPKTFGNLTPKIFRAYIISRQNKSFELSIIEEFKKKAPALSNNTPDSDDHISWLFLMQHYGTPTRLLDWTESALIALYFVVCDTSFEDEDGELWAMYPYKLNEESNINGFPLLENPKLQYPVIPLGQHK